MDGSAILCLIRKGQYNLDRPSVDVLRGLLKVIVALDDRIRDLEGSGRKDVAAGYVLDQ